MAYLDSYESSLDMTEISKLYGIRLTSTEEFLRYMFRWRISAAVVFRVILPLLRSAVITVIVVSRL
jgi:hypothetical protein